MQKEMHLRMHFVIAYFNIPENITQWIILHTLAY